MTNFSIGTLVGLILGSMASLLTDPAKTVNSARQAFLLAKEAGANAAITNRKRELWRSIFAPMMIIVFLLNASVLVLVVLIIVFGPHAVLGLLFDTSGLDAFTSADRAILSVVGLVQLLLLVQKCVTPIQKAVKEALKGGE